ncbi:MAG: hypothetical protein B6D44_16075 [Ignavibacteriales bacterium UTCHB2]|jgi:hypothetical protein|nr:MAG: hypothetical protein B6D44_16075 [Ignavibacteriales bacterium UTCHB2]
MEDLKNLSLPGIVEELENVEKKIEIEKVLMKKAKNAHFQDGEVWLTYKLQYKRIDKIVDENTKKLLFNKKQIEEVRKSLENISELRKRKNELLLEKVKRKLKNELYEGIVDFDNKAKNYLSYNFNIEDIKEYGNRLSDEQKYKYYARLDTELDRIINAFNFSEFRRFDGNMYFGLIEFFDSVEYIIEKEKCPELERIAREKIKNVDIYAGEKEFKLAITMIEFELILLPERLVKTRELLGYELKYLKKILKMDTKKTEDDKIVSEEEVTEKSLLKRFGRGELQKELKKYVKEFELQKGVTVESKKVQLITRKLRDEGWDATEQSVAVTLRKMEYGEEWRRDY